MRIAIIGGGGFCGEMVDALRAQYSDNPPLAGVYDDDTRLRQHPVYGLKYLGTTFDYLDSTEAELQYVVAVEDNRTRQELVMHFEAGGKRATTVLHPQASVSPAAFVQEGVYIAAGAFIGPRCRIEKHAIVNVGASVGHDAVVQEFAQLCAGSRVSGYCRLGTGSFVGSNAVLAPTTKMGDWSKLQAGSFAARDIPPGRLAAGNPAKVVL